LTRAFAFFAVFLFVGVVVQTGFAPAARAETRVVESSVENAYPGDLIFHLKAAADVNITSISLTLSHGSGTSSALREPDPFTPASEVEVSVSVDVTSGNIQVPLSADVTYSWRITTADGNTFTSEPATFAYLPPDRDWQHIESGVMRVYYHGERERAARELLIAGQDAYDQMSALLQTKLEVVPVRVMMFVTEDEMNAAREGRSTTLDDFTQTCGLKVATDVVYVIQTCNSISTAEILRHELTHIIVEAAGEGPLSVMPAWLNEGTATYAQTTPGSGFEGAFNAATRTGRFLPFADMTVPANDPGNTNLFYGQSRAMVRFLVERGGPEDFARLFALMKDGTRYDRALEQVYGFDVAGFQAEFVASFNQQQQTPTAAPTSTPAQQRPTQAVPTRAPIATSNTDGDDDGLNVAAIAIVAVAVLFGLLAVFAYLLSSMLAANRRVAAIAVQSHQVAGPPAEDAWERPAPPPGPDGETLLRQSPDPSDEEPDRS